MPRGSGTAGGPPAHPPVAGPGSSQLLTQTLRGPHVRGVPGVCRMRKGADDDRDARHPPPHDRNESIPCVPARLPHLKPPNAAAAAARRLASHRPPPARTAPRHLFSRPIASKGERRWPLFTTTSDARPASGSRPSHAAAPRGQPAPAADPPAAASPASPQPDPPRPCPPRRTAQPVPRAAPATRSSPGRRHAAFPPPRPPPPPAACWPATARTPAAPPASLRLFRRTSGSPRL